MNHTKTLTPKQQYLQHLLSKPSDEQVDRMVAAIKAKQKSGRGRPLKRKKIPTQK